MKFAISIFWFITLAEVFCSSIQQKNKLNFKITNDWNIIPNKNGELLLLHRTEIENSSDLERKFDPERDMKLHLYTRNNPDRAETFKLSEIDSIENSENFNPKNSIRFIVHGWNAPAQSGGHLALTSDYLKISENNVILVDWFAGAGTPNYLGARNNVRKMGIALGGFIDKLVEKNLADLDKITLIGHSLGGQAVGMVGKNIKSGKVNTIIGLDPAGPLFNYDDPDDRLDKNDAKYVEVIHTNGGVLGMFKPFGTSDFYANGGKSQPGCGIDAMGSCAHGRSFSYFRESLLTNIGFWSIPCDENDAIGKCSGNGSMALLGGEPSNYNKNISGIFSFSTAKKSPYALGTPENL